MSSITSAPNNTLVPTAKSLRIWFPLFGRPRHSVGVKREMPTVQSAEDTNGHIVQIGTRMRVLSLSGKWLDELPNDEKDDVLSMIGEVFEVEEIDEYGQPWVGKQSHSVALASYEMEVVSDSASKPGSRQRRSMICNPIDFGGSAAWRYAYTP
jgi:hypothetical protein